MVNPVTGTGGTGGTRQTSSSTAPSTPTPTPTRARGVQYQVEPGSTASQQRLQTVFATLSLNRQRREAGQTPVLIPSAEMTPPQPSALSQLLLGAASAGTAAASAYLTGSAVRNHLATRENHGVITTSPPITAEGSKAEAVVTSAPVKGSIKAVTLNPITSAIEPIPPHAGTIMTVTEQGGDFKATDAVKIHRRKRQWYSNLWARTGNLPHDLTFRVQTTTDEWFVTNMRLCIWNDEVEIWTPSTGRGGWTSVIVPKGTRLPLKIEGRMDIFGWGWHGPYPTRHSATLSSVDCREKTLNFKMHGSYYTYYSSLEWVK